MSHPGAPRDGAATAAGSHRLPQLAVERDPCPRRSWIARASDRAFAGMAQPRRSARRPYV